MFTRIGMLSLLAGFIVAVLGTISRFMKADNFWVDLTLSRVTGAYTDSIVELIPVEAVQDGLYTFMYDLPLFGVILGIGALFLLIGMIFKA